MAKSAMKFKLALVLAVLLLLSSICDNSMMVYAKSKADSSASVSINKAALTKRTTDYASQFINGNFDDFYKACTKQIRQKISVNVLQQGWNKIVAITGKPGKSLSCTYAKQFDQYVLTDTIECTLYNIKMTITYNTKAKPVGIWTSFIPKDPPKPQSADKWEEFSVTVGDKNLNGMLTLPKGVQKPPVVIMIQGSGSSDMNESVGAAPNRPFEDIAHGLAEQGVATLRYNKSTYQYLTSGEATIEYEMLNDAAAAVKMLSNDNRIDPSKIYLLGHSLGGMMAPKITADNPQIKGFISMAGSLRSIQDLMLDQNKAALDAEVSLTEQQKNDMLAQINAEIQKTKTLDNSSTNSILSLPTSYWKSLNAIDSISIVNNLKVPMLILQGSADFQVYPDKDYKLWQTVLKDHNNVTYHLYDGLSHLFMPDQISANGAPDISVYNAPNHVAPQVITDIAAWVNAQS